MRHVQLDSSNLNSVGYDPQTEVLEIEFVDGALYRYFSVTRMLHQGLITAESPGRFLHQHIKGQYRYEKVR